MRSELKAREKTFQRINWGMLFAMVLTALSCIFFGLQRNDVYAAFQAALAIAMFTFPTCITHLLHFYIPQDCRLLYYIFTFSTVVVGSAMYGYSWLPYWDKLFHFFSGILISAAGLMLCHLLFGIMAGKGTLKARRTLYLTFPFLFNLSVAALWEVYEYMLYLLFGIDAVNHLTTGVNDTLQDIIVCLLGGILFSGLLIRAFHSRRLGFLLNTCVHFSCFHGEKLEF